MFGDYDLTPQLQTWKQIKDIATVMTGTTPDTGNMLNWGGSILWITPADMNSDSFIIKDTVRKITGRGQKSKLLQIMPEGTVLLSTRAPIGKVGIVGKPMCCNQGFKNMYFKESLINPIFAYFLFKLNNQYLQSLGTGTTFKEISKTVVEKIRIPSPNILEQNEFSRFVSLIDKSKFVVHSRYFL
jgi:type I restriction enzyme S subunit